MATDDVRYTVGILNLVDSARFLDIPRQTFHRHARTNAADVLAAFFDDPSPR